MPSFKTIDDLTGDLDVSGKNVLVRVDLNVPMANGKITDATRIQRIKPTITELAEKGAKVILLAHFGRPNGKVNSEMSLAPIVPTLAKEFGIDVGFCDDTIGEQALNYVNEMQNGDVLLLENVRFYEGEENNDPDFCKELAKLGDIYINDAFSTAHRAHASTEGIAKLLPCAAGRTMQSELEALEAGLGNPERPIGAVVGGAKVSTKIDLLESLVIKIDVLIIGGGMANTFLAANGANMGASLQEADMHDKARAIMAAAIKNDCRIVLPIDGRITTEFKAGAATQMVVFDTETKLSENQMSLDAGDAAIENVMAEFEKLKTLIWNGPFGVFEMPPFDTATMATAKKAAELTKAGKLVSVAGGGDTVLALNLAGVADDFTYISTAGGAFLEWMEGKELPGVAALK